MLSRLQTEKLARREGVPTHVIERDYVQHLLARHVAEDPLVFKGGTCIRIALGSPRFSEDMDFTARESSDVEAAVLGALKRLRDYGVAASLRRSRAEGGGWNAVVRYEGPLFTGDSRSARSIRLEVSLRPERLDVEEVFVSQARYPDLPQLVLRILRRDHILAEKLRALIIRSKPRDLFDVHFLMSRGVRCPPPLLAEKMRLYGRPFRLSDFDKAVKEAGATWQRDLTGLLGQVPPHAAVAEQARRMVREAVVGPSRPGHQA